MADPTLDIDNDDAVVPIAAAPTPSRWPRWVRPRLPNWRWFSDFIWPTAPPVSRAETTKLEQLCATEKRAVEDARARGDEKWVEDACKATEDLLTCERERRASVESRLSGVLALTSVAATIVLAVVTFLTKSAPDAVSFTASSVVAVSGCGTYIAIQFLNALWAAVNGLARGGATEAKFLGRLPAAGEDTIAFRSRYATLRCETRKEYQSLIDQKVTQMAIAHRALRNALGMMVFTAVVLFGIAVRQVCMGHH